MERISRTFWRGELKEGARRVCKRVGCCVYAEVRLLGGEGKKRRREELIMYLAYYLRHDEEQPMALWTVVSWAFWGFAALWAFAPGINSWTRDFARSQLQVAKQRTFPKHVIRP